MSPPSALVEIHQKLAQAFGPQNWWPAGSPLEVCVGAILVQNTNWQNVTQAIANLKSHDALHFDVLLGCSLADLEKWIQPAGSYCGKARTLKNFTSAIFEQHGHFAALASLSDQRLQEFLISIKGIGPETCDSMLLYAFGRPVFVVDRYTHRLLARHRLLPLDADFFELKDYCTRHFGSEVPDLQECHALIVRLGKEFCKKTKPLCETCPLKDLNGGPCLESEF